MSNLDEAYFKYLEQFQGDEPELRLTIGELKQRLSQDEDCLDRKGYASYWFFENGMQIFVIDDEASPGKISVYANHPDRYELRMGWQGIHEYREPLQYEVDKNTWVIVHYEPTYGRSPWQM